MILIFILSGGVKIQPALPAVRCINTFFPFYFLPCDPTASFISAVGAIGHSATDFDLSGLLSAFAST